MSVRIAIVLLAAAVCGCSPEPEPELERLAFGGAPGSAQPRLAADADGTPVMSWLEPEGDDTVLRYARYESGGFGEPHEVARSARMFVNWADFPSVTPVTDELWFAHWLRRRPEGYAYDIATAISNDGGTSWSEAEQMNEDDAEAEHGFVSVFPWDGQIAAFWLDGRELAEWSFDNPDALLGVSLRLARYADDGGVTARRVVDDLVCDCCQPDVAMTGAGPVVIYRDRTEAEIRDIVVRRHVDGRWTEPVNLGNEGWHIEACPVNGPVIAARGTDVVAAWFTAADDSPRVRFARSTDSGQRFGAAIDVDGAGSYGQPSIVLDDDGRALVGWWRRGEENGIDLVVRSYARDGSAGAEQIVTHETVSQPIDVPQMIAADGGYLIAWTTFDDDGSVRLARLDI